VALTQSILTITADAIAAGSGRATWTTGLATPKLVAAVPVLPADASLTDPWGVHIRARIDAGVVTVDAHHPSQLGPLQVLVTVDS